MSDNDNVKIVQDGYAEFLRGDIPAVLNRFADDLEFTTPGAPVVPYAGTKRNKNELAGFFQKLNETVNISLFEPREYVAHGDRVVALGHYAGEVRSTGKAFASDWAMVWTIRDGKVTRFHEYSDPSELKAGFGA